MAKRTLSKKEQDEIKKKVSVLHYYFYFKFYPRCFIEHICVYSLSVHFPGFRKMSGQQQRSMRSFLLLSKEVQRAKSRPLSVGVLQMLQKVTVLSSVTVFSAAVS